MEKGDGKPWERPWSTDEIRDQSSNWNLAGDSGLLHHLQQFSENLLTRTHETEVSVNQLMEDVKKTTTDVENVMNTFLALANTQFVENRVYDDDEKETPPEEKKEEEKVKTKEQHEAEVIEKVKNALQVGMAVLDTHFDAVEVPASDSEEEESSASVGRLVLKSRNLYATRPLPYIIGSQEFMEDDKVGLGDLSSDTEESPDQNIIQSSESDEEIEHDDAPTMTKRAKMVSSSDSENSEPESDRGGSVSRQKPHHKTSVSAEGDMEVDGDIFGQESPPEADVRPSTRGSLPSALTDELSTKLGAEKRETSTPRPKKESDNIFLPPSEPEEDSSLFGYYPPSFSGGRGLFDDLDDWNATSNSLWKADENSPKKVPEKLAKDPGKDVKQPQTSEKQSFGNTDQAQSIFDDSQEDDLFSTSNPKPQSTVSEVLSREQKTSIQETKDSTSREGSVFSKIGETSDSQQISGSPGSFGRNDAEDDLFSTSSVINSSQDTTKRKKLAGAVPVFSDVNLFGNKPPSLGNRRISESSDDVKKPSKITSEPSPNPIGAPTLDVHTAKKPSKDVESNGGDDLFNPSSVPVRKKAPSLFGENDDEHESGGLFSKPKTTVGISKNTPATKSAMSSGTGARPKKPISLFDESDSGDDELLFSSTSSTSSRSRRSQASGDLLAAPIERKILPKKGLDDLFFGISTQEEPDFDIFGSKQSTITKPSSIAEEVSDNSSGIGATFGRAKVSSGLFDDIDEVDDIFVITKKIPETIPNAASEIQTKPQSSLFSNQADETDDIFSSKPFFSASAGPGASESVPKIANTITEQETEYIFSSKPLIIEKNLQSRDSLNVSTAISSLDNKTLFDDEDDIFSSKLLVHHKEDNGEVPSVKSIKGSEPVIDDIFSSKSLVSDESESTNETKPELPENNLEPATKDVVMAGSRETKSKPSVSQKPIIGKKPPSSTKASSKPSVPERKVKQVETADVPPTSTKLSSVTGSGADKAATNPSKPAEEPVLPSSKPEPPRTLNIRKTTDVLFGPPSNENDLFDPLWTDNSQENKVNDQKSLKGAVSSNSFGALLKDYESAVEKSSTYIRESPKKEKPEGKITGALEDGAEVGQTEKLPSKVSKLSPGKLIIDPTALLPGAKHPGHPRTPETGVAFDKPFETSGMLHSAGKERVKIQVRRRPQSRRARQEALRASFAEHENVDAALISQVADDKNETNTNLLPDNRELYLSAEDSKDDQQVPTDTEDSQITVSDDQFETTSAISKQTNYLEANSNPLSPSTDEEDLFAVPQELPYDETSSKDQTQDYKNMFGGAPVLSPVDSKPEISSLFEPPMLNNPKREINEAADKQFDGSSPGKGDLFEKVDHSVKGTTASAPQETDNVPGGISKENLGDNILSKDNSNLLNDKLNFDDSDDDLFSAMKRSTEDKRMKAQDKQSFLTDDFSLFPPSSTDVLDIQKSSTKGKDLFSPREEDIDSLFMSKKFKDSQINKSSDFLSVGATVKDSQNIPDILGGADLSDNFLSKKIIETDKQTKSQTGSLFGETFGDSDDLFGSAISAPKKAASSISASKLKGSSLFEDTGEDDDIFSSSSIKSNKPKAKNLIQASSENLFSETADGDDHADLFSSRPSSSKSQKAKHSLIQKKQATEEIFDDPLMVVKK